jgi:hypothetical protein
VWFTVHFFSIPQLLRSWIAPWKRITEERTKAWDIEDFFGSLIINLISRIIGFIMRTVVLLIGTISLLLSLLSGVVVYVVWTIAPALIILMIIMGAGLIITM